MIWDEIKRKNREAIITLPLCLSFFLLFIIWHGKYLHHPFSFFLHTIINVDFGSIMPFSYRQGTPPKYLPPLFQTLKFPQYQLNFKLQFVPLT